MKIRCLSRVLGGPCPAKIEMSGGRGLILIRIPVQGDHHVLKGFAACALVISLVNGLILAKTYHIYSQPNENTLYFKEGR